MTLKCPHCDGELDVAITASPTPATKPKPPDDNVMRVQKDEDVPTFVKRAKDNLAQKGKVFDFSDWKRRDAIHSVGEMTHKSWAPVKASTEEK